MLVLLPRLIVGAATGLLASWLSLATLAPGLSFEFVLPVRSSQPTYAQLYFDRGAGFVEADSTWVAVPAADTMTEVRLTVPWGRYRALRVDPGTVASEYTIGHARIEDGDGQTVASFGSGGFEALRGVRVLERTTAATVLLATDPDPQLVTVFARPLDLTPPHPVGLVLFAGGLMLLAIVAVVLIEPPPGGVGLHTRAWTSYHGALAVWLVATLAALTATYPLLVGRSLVSPNLGPVVMLYDRPPYLSGSTGDVLEDVRGSDTGSTMWGIMPYSRVQREAIRAGEWPLWQRYSGLGRPLWGQGQSLFLDPLHLASLIVPDTAAGWDFKFVGARIVFAAGAGMATLAATGSPVAGAMVGAFAPFIGYFTYRLNHPASFSITYAPWLLWTFVQLARQRSRRDALAWGAALACATSLQIVSSTPKEGVIALLGCYIVGGVAVLVRPGAAAERLVQTMALVAGASAGLLLSAPHWLVFLDTLSRAWTVYDVPAVRLASMSDLSRLALGAIAGGTPWPSAHMLVMVGAALSLVALPALRAGRALLIGCWVAVLSCLAVALGAIPTPWLLKLPLIGNLYSINTSFFGAALAPLLLAAGFGFAALPSVTQGGRSVAAFSVLLAGGTASALWWQGGYELLHEFRGQWVLATLAAALVFPWACASWQLGRTRWTGLTATAILTAVILVPGGLHLDTGNPRLDGVLMQPRLRPDLSVASPAVAAAVAASEDPFRAIGLGYVFFPGTQALWGIEGIIGADAIEGPWLRQLGTAAGMFRHPFIWLSVFDESDLTSKAGLLDLFGVRIVFADPAQLAGRWRELPPAAPDRLRVIERPSAWPRAFFVDTIQVYDEPSDLLTTLAGATGPFGAIQASDARARDLASRFVGEPGAPRYATRYRLTPNSTTFDIEAPGPGVVIVAEAYDETDFVATVNGKEVPYFRVNHLFKAVAIPGSGTWTVRFEYRPALWQWAWAMAATGLVLVLALLGQRRV